MAPLIAAVSLASASAFTWFGGVKGALQFDLSMFASSIVGSVVFAAVGMYRLLRRASSANNRFHSPLVPPTADLMASNRRMGKIEISNIEKILLFFNTTLISNFP